MNLTDNSEREIIDATRPFAREQRGRSWFHVATTLGLTVAVLALAGLYTWWPLRLVVSIVGGLMLVRSFILFHDFLHGALLRDSAFARGLFSLFGLALMTPVKVWRETHNYHHANNAKIIGSNIGSFATVTTQMWEGMSPAQRFAYRMIRNPVTILLAHFALFLYGMGVQPFLRAPKKHWAAIVAFLMHILSWAAAYKLGIFVPFFFGWIFPLAFAHMMGGYLFYAQHNFPTLKLRSRSQWTYVGAALESSSFMEMSPLMHYFTGNIGYHHVHHLNPQIPFYRLPEAMAAIPALQSPGRTSLSVRDILDCLRLKLWSPEDNAMVEFPDTEIEPELGLQ